MVIDKFILMIIYYMSVRQSEIKIVPNDQRGLVHTGLSVLHSAALHDASQHQHTIKYEELTQLTLVIRDQALSGWICTSKYTKTLEKARFKF